MRVGGSSFRGGKLVMVRGVTAATLSEINPVDRA